MGIEGIFSYNHGQSGASFNGNKEKIETLNVQCNELGLHYVPTVSVGFNCIGWMNPRSPLISVEEFAEINKWVRDEYLPASTNAPAWAENLVWLSTWNEYGEGTYMMPAEGLNGFGYLDVIRETYTSEKADESLNTVPTASQLERIGRLYPQHMKLLRAEELEPYTNGIYEPKPMYDVGNETVLKADFSTDVIGIADNLAVSGNTISNSSNKSGKVIFNLEKGVDLTLCSRIEVKAEIPEGKGMPVGYGNGDISKFTSVVSKVIKGERGTNVYELEISGAAAGTAVQISLPAGSKLYEVRVLGDERTLFAYNLTIDGKTITPKVPPELSQRGEYLFGFDTIFSDLHPYGIFTEWDPETKVMTVNTPGDIFEFTVGSAFYKRNGIRHYLGYKLYEKDKVPMIPLAIIGERLGFKVDHSDIKNVTVTK